MKAVDQIAKALLGAIIAGLGSLAAVLVGDVSVADVTAGQWVTVALTTAVALGVVYGVPNAAPPKS